MSKDSPLVPDLTTGIPEVDTPVSDIKDTKRRNSEVDRMYAQYTEYVKKPIVIPYSVFAKYEVLYTIDALQDIENPRSTNHGHYSDLVSEWIKILGNPYKEYYVLMPNGEHIAFPPIFTPISTISNDMVDNVDVFSNILDKCKDQPWRRSEATHKLLKAIYESQSGQLIQYQREKTRSIADKLKVHAASSISTSDTKEVTSDSSTVIGDMEFVLDD